MLTCNSGRGWQVSIGRGRRERKKEREKHANFDHNASDIILPTQKFEAGRGSILYNNNNNNNQELPPLDVSSPPLASLPPPSLPPPLTSGSFFSDPRGNLAKSRSRWLTCPCPWRTQVSVAYNRLLTFSFCTFSRGKTRKPNRWHARCSSRVESEKRQKASAYLGRSRHQLSVCTRHPGRRVSQSRGRPPQKQPTVTDEASQGAAAPESHMARATRDRHRLAFTFRRPLRDAAPWRAVQRCAVPCCLAAAAGCAAMDATVESSSRSEELFVPC